MAYIFQLLVASTDLDHQPNPYKTPYNKSKIPSYIPYTASALHILFQPVYHTDYFLKNSHISNNKSMYHFDLFNNYTFLLNSLYLYIIYR